MKLKNFLRGFGILAVVLTLLPLIAVDYWWIRIFDFPHAQLTGLTLLAIITYFIKFNRSNRSDYIFVIVLVACFMFQLTKIYSYLSLVATEAQESTITDASKTIKIYSANVLQTNTYFTKVLDQITHKDPDIILLMETNQAWKDAIHSQLAQTYSHHLLEPLDNTYGMLLYSRLPLENKRIRHLVDKDIPSMVAIATLNSGDQIQLYAIHPTPPMPQHNPMSSDRDTEMMTTALQINNRSLPVIVMGDFNDVAWSRTTSLFRKASRLLDSRIGRGFYNTFNAKNVLMRWPLDHLFTSEEFRVQALIRTPDISSDHFPLYAEFTFEPEIAQEQLADQPTREEVQSAQDQRKEEHLLEKNLPFIKK